MANVVAPGDGDPINPLMTHKVRSGDLPGGHVAVIEGVLPPGEFIGPHTHSREDEVSYILEGAVTFQVGERRFVAEAGSYVLKPRGVQHAFWNASSTTARVMEIHAPGGFERFYDEMEAVMSEQSSSESERFAAFRATASSFGVTHDLEGGAALRADVGLGG